MRQRSNLEILTKATVLRLIFEKDRAVGVEFERNGAIHKIACNKEIILCAGAFNTPKILMLSGIGPRSEIEKHGIDLVADLPGVGANLSDHLMSPFNVLAPAGVNVSVPMDSSKAAIEQWRKDKTGPAIYWSANTIGFISADGKSHGPDFVLMMDYNSGFNTSDPTVKEQNDLANRSGYTFMIIQLQPESRGTVRLKSADPKDDPIIDPAYLSNPNDIKNFINVFRQVAAMPKTPALKPFTDIISPAIDASDAEIEEHIRKTASTVYHPVGTVKMGDDDDPMSVVNANLKVRKVQGLRVADVSVLPKVNRGHTMVPGIIIGEKCAEFILKG